MPPPDYHKEIDDYHKEIDEFLERVNKLTEDDFPASAISNTHDDDVDATAANNATDETIEVVQIVDANGAVVKEASHRFRWKFQNVVVYYYDYEKRVRKYRNPFLDDGNTHDLIFSELLITEQPYRANKKGQALNEFILHCRNAVNSAGKKPLELINPSSYRTRTRLYRTLASYWNDKTGPVLSNGKELGDEWRNKNYKDMTVAEKIAYNVDKYIEDSETGKKLDSKKEEESELICQPEKQDKATDTDGWCNKNSRDMTVTEKIAHNVDNYIEDYEAVKKLDSKNEQESELKCQPEKQDKAAGTEVKMNALGKLVQTIIIP
jgi:hypothetical protein